MNLRLVHVGKKKLQCAAIFVLLPLTAALSLDASARSVSGNISLSTSTTGTRAYLSLILPFDALINASMPLSLDSEILNSASFTAKGKLGGLTLAAGKLKISDAASFLARPDLVSSRGSSLMYSGNLGSASDPLGISATSSRLSLFLAKGEIYSCGALQYLFLDNPARVAISVGALLDEEDQNSVLHRMKPWLALGSGYSVSNISFLARLHVYPDLEAHRGDFSWLKAAAGRLDISLRASKQKMKGFLYAETGDFISATGKAASHDAMAQLDYEVDISRIPLSKNFSAGLSVFSKQGAAVPVMGDTPSFGTLPDPFALKYWPDGGKVHFDIENKEVRTHMFDTDVGLSPSFSGTVAREEGQWSGKMGFDLDVRKAMSKVSQLGVGFALQISCSEQESASDGPNETFAGIAEYEGSDDTSATARNMNGKFIFDRGLVALRAAFDPFSCSVSADMPLGHSDSNTLHVKIRISAKMSHFFVEASGTGKFEMGEKQFSIASAHLYVKIPL
ncbi:MAG: hypothetical protein SAMD01599839_18680 [Rectinema sp.]